MVTTVSGTTGVSMVQDGAVSTDKIVALAVTPDKLSQKMTLGMEVATTSGTSIDITGLPSWVKRITVMFNGVSTNGSSSVVLRLGTVSGTEIAGYTGSCLIGAGGSVYSGGSFELESSGSATVTRQGFASLVLADNITNRWKLSSMIGRVDTPYIMLSAGDKSLSGILDRLRLTTVNGTDTFDAGSVNILYEG